jgi:flagellar operon protein
MSEPLRINELLIAPRGPGLRPAAAKPARQSEGAGSFADLLKQAQTTGDPNALVFSAHAQTRIQSRQIQLGSHEMQRIQNAVQMAAGKGSRESLVLLDQTALVVSVPNRTVITVVDKDNLRQNVFTNIDSAVIA